MHLQFPNDQLIPNGQLTPELRQELTLANDRAKVVRKAARVANFNGWATAVIAVFSAPFAPFGIEAFLMTCGLACVAYNEFRGRKRLLNYDPSAASLLGWNQLGLLAMISVYCLWMSLTSVQSFTSELRAHPELQEAIGSLDDFDGLFRSLVLVFYGTVVLLSLVFQGLTALYYFTRRKYIEAYVQQTPAYVQEIARVTSAL